MNDKWILHIVSHTHWDREWYMGFQAFRRRFVKLMDHLLRLFENESDFKYFTLDGQVLVLKDYLEIRPEKEEEIARLVKEGRLIIGPWYSQPNEFMVSGESMIRNLILGIRESEKFGCAMNICYLPDAFGHISQLPQIIRGFEMQDAVAWRGIPKGSKTVFKWFGTDGSWCYMFYMVDSYGNAVDLPLNEDNGGCKSDSTQFPNESLMMRISRIINRLGPRAAVKCLLLMNGVDHSFAQDNLPEVIEKINRMCPDVSAVHCNLADYVSNVRRLYQEKGMDSESEEGELRDPSEVCILPGSQSTRSDVKIVNSRIEGLFEKWMEPFSSYAWLSGLEYPGAEIWKAWEYLLQNHAHDSLACSSLDQVYHQILTRFAWARELGDAIVYEGLQYISNRIKIDNGSKNNLLINVFNPLNWTRNEIIEAVIDIPKALKIDHPVLTDGGGIIPMVVRNSRDATVIRFNPRKGHPDSINVKRYDVVFQTGNIPANGYKAFVLKNEGYQLNQTAYADCSDVLLKDKTSMENEFFILNIHQDGTLNIFDKVNDCHYGPMHFFEDSGEAGNGFSHSTPPQDCIIYSYGEKADISIVSDCYLKTVLGVSMVMNIPARLSVDRVRRMDETVQCIISSEVALYKGIPRIDITTEVDNQARDHRFRVLFPSNINAKYSYAEQPFDVVRRNIKVPEYSEDMDEEPSPTHPQLSFVDISDGNKGLMIANDGLYEYEVIDDDRRSIALTLLRCTDKLYGFYFAECEETQIPEAQCVGKHVFRYSIIPHQGTWESAYKRAYEFKYPMLAIQKHGLDMDTLMNCRGDMRSADLPMEMSYVDIKPDALIITAVKKHETSESLVIRIANLCSGEVRGCIRVSKTVCKYHKAYITNLKEERKGEAEIDEEGWINLPIRGKGFLTLEIPVI